MKKYCSFIILFFFYLISAQAEENRLIDFRLIDQNANFHQEEDYTGTVLIVIASDKARQGIQLAMGKYSSRNV